MFKHLIDWYFRDRTKIIKWNIDVHVQHESNGIVGLAQNYRDV